MSMSGMTERLQVLIDRDRLERLKRQAEASGASVGSLVRDAIDRTYPAVPASRAQAIREILDLEPAPVPSDFETMKREIESTYEPPLP